MRKKKCKISLYQKFAITIILIGLLPMAIITTFISNRMITDYEEALITQFQQAAEYISYSVESVIDTLNNVSKMPYYYNQSGIEEVYTSSFSFDNIRQILYGEIYSEELVEIRRKTNMEMFLQYIGSTNANIINTHFMGNDSKKEIDFHWSLNSTYFKDLSLFCEKIHYDDLDKTTNKLIIIPTHETGYFNGLAGNVFTIARNYFDLRGSVGNTPYVGTLFIDVNLEQFKKIFRSVSFTGNETIYVVFQNEECLFSNKEEYVGKNISTQISEKITNKESLFIQTAQNSYEISVIIEMNTKDAFANIKAVKLMIYLILFISACALLASSVFFSKKLTRPIHEIIEQMKEVRTGNFDIVIPVRTNDEIGILADSFNQMSEALKNYIEQSYVAQIKQNEAELTALKSQIYPHFLYNTLEIIRMTALEDGEQKVPEMIEALSTQIHYLIGPMKDMVTLKQEIYIVEKYVYLLNCRIQGKVKLNIMISNKQMEEIEIPKLILQPIIENSYVHGIKQKQSNGSIVIEAIVQEQQIEIIIMDNGVGMDEDELKSLYNVLNSNEPGIKNEHNWQSIGLKNVNDRIRYLYGEQYGLCITSTKGIGTMVRIIIPRKKRVND